MAKKKTTGKDFTRDYGQWKFNLDLNDLSPKEGYKMAKDIAKILCENKDGGEVYETGDDEKVLERFETDLHLLSEFLMPLAHACKCAGPDHPTFLKTWQSFVHTLGMGSHDYYTCMGFCPKIEGFNGDDFYSQMWRVNEYDDDTYSTVCWMIDRQAENIVKQLFPVKNKKELARAMYNFWIYLAATCASEYIGLYEENCDWAGLLENGQFLKSSENKEFIVEGISVTDGSKLGNPNIEGEKLNGKD